MSATVNQPAPLSWPPDREEGLPRSWWTRFLLGMPWGPQVRAHRFICRQLESRSDAVLGAWRSEPFAPYADLAADISTVLQEHLDWPNTRFIPADPFQILMWAPNDDLDTMEAWMAIEETLGNEVSEGAMEASYKMSYREVLEMLSHRT